MSLASYHCSTPRLVWAVLPSGFPPGRPTLHSHCSTRVGAGGTGEFFFFKKILPPGEPWPGARPPGWGVGRSIMFDCTREKMIHEKTRPGLPETGRVMAAAQPQARSQPARKPEWAPRIWEGCNFSAWLRLLVRNRFAVHWSHLYIALVVTVISLCHTVLRLIQSSL